MSIKKIKDFLQTLIEKIIRDDFFGMASEMAYMFALGIFPLLTFVTGVFGWLGKKYLISNIMHFIDDFIPLEVINLMKIVLQEVINIDNSGIYAILCFVVTIALASNAVAVVSKGLNRAYDITETRSFLHTRILSILMVFANSLFIFLCVNLIIFGKVILHYVILFTNLGAPVVNLISIIRWPIAFAALYLMAFLNYYILPDVRGPEEIKRKSTIYGTLFFCVFWLLGSSSFSVYINNLNTYNRVYGALGAVAILLVWLYYTSLIMLIGGEINSATYRRLLAKKS